MSRNSLLFAAVALLALMAPRPAHGDEFKLKDGSVIVGTVVGYVGNSFRVKTSYGYALVEKDKIASIKISAAPEPAPERKPKTDAPKPPLAERLVTNASKIAPVEEHATAEKKSKPTAAPTAPAQKTKTLDASANASLPTANQASPAVAAASSNPQTAVAAALPEPRPIREKISGNTYINDTYAFQMYKPPDWQIMDGARSVLPGAIAAMGTDDQSTYLVVGQETSGKPAAAEIAATEERLREILVNFRPLGSEPLTISGEQVVAHRFRGSIDEHDWSGFMVFLPRGAKLYTIFGMTRADDDLVQIQENVIRRTIASFQFLPQ